MKYKSDELGGKRVYVMKWEESVYVMNWEE